MENLKKKFENETKTRINIIDSYCYEKINFKRMLVKQGIFDIENFMFDSSFNNFPTEIFCSSTKSNTVNVYLSIKKKEEIYKDIKENILKSIYKASVVIKNENKKYSLQKDVTEFQKNYISILNQLSQFSLNKFYGVDNIEKIFESIKFNELFNEIKEMDNNINQEIIENKDDIIWEKFFCDFNIQFQNQYYTWMKMISKYYIENEAGHKYVNQHNNINKYSNNDFDNLCKIIYGSKSSCDIMIERVYIDAPASNEQFIGNVYIYYNIDAKNRIIHDIIENRISEDYKEVFLILAKCSDPVNYFSSFRENINKVTLDKRIFCILNEFDFYREQLFREENKINYINSEDNLVDSIKMNVSKKMGISSNKIIVTEQFKDIDKNNLKALNTNEDFINLLKLIKLKSERIGSVIKIKPSNKDRIISISLNQERMSVQALMGMLYDRYNGYLVDQWKKIIEDDKSNIDSKRYYSVIRNIIQNRKDNYKEYENVFLDDCNQNYNNIIDFSLRSGDYNDSKKILKMLVNYGYNTVGFNSNENKILVTVNGEISKEHKENLIKSIKGRLEESIINYFENAFSTNVSKKRFNESSLDKALEWEKNITIDDFYSTFKEIFRKMSDNIVRYEVNLQ